MKQKTPILTIIFLAAVLLTACATQQTPESSLVGTEAPDFTLENTLGGQTSLSDYQGTPVLLYFHMAVG